LFCKLIATIDKLIPPQTPVGLREGHQRIAPMNDTGELMWKLWMIQRWIDKRLFVGKAKPFAV
jgi:hypothetical protein